jgi:hypothetical protein
MRGNRQGRDTWLFLLLSGDRSQNLGSAENLLFSNYLTAHPVETNRKVFLKFPRLPATNRRSKTDNA